MVTTGKMLAMNPGTLDRKKAGFSFFWLCAFYTIYCARPEDWLHVIAILPLAKIAGVGAFLAFLLSARKGKRSLRDLPAESYYLLVLIGLLFLSAIFSPIWRGGALSHTIDFAKVYVVWILTFLLLTDLDKFRRLLFIQAASVPAICLLSMIKGRGHSRLDSVLGGIYSNPNDLAFAIVLSLPICLMFLLSTRSAMRKLLWTAAILVMATALVMTASRGGFITLIVAGVVCLWHFGVKGRRFYLIVGSACAGVVLLAVAGGTMKERFVTLWADDINSREQARAAGSLEQRKELNDRALQGIREYPILGIGAQNFETYSGSWHEVHMTYLQVGVEAGVPALIVYLIFFGLGFRNLRRLLRRRDLDPQLKLAVWALHSSLVGFAVGASFSPEAYQFFPFFTVAYTSALFAIVREKDTALAAEAQAVRAAAENSYVREDRVPVNT